MSKRHQASRRKAYARRQHELRERSGRTHRPDPVEFAFDDEELETMPQPDPFAFLDPRAPRLRFGYGD